MDEGVAAAEPNARADEASVEPGEAHAGGGTVDLPSDRAVFCTSTRLLRKSVRDLPRMLMGDRRKDFLAMREFLREVLRLDGGVTITTETFNERVQTVS